MNIELNGQSYKVPREYQDKLIGQMWDLFLGEYEKIPLSYRLMGKPVARKMLYDMEKDLAKTHPKELAAQICRPAKNADPNTHLLWIMTGVIREGVRNATLSINAEETSNRVDAFAISIQSQSQGGGSLAADGDQRERENHGGENARYEIGPAISNE